MSSSGLPGSLRNGIPFLNNRFGENNKEKTDKCVTSFHIGKICFIRKKLSFLGGAKINLVFGKGDVRELGLEH